MLCLQLLHSFTSIDIRLLLYIQVVRRTGKLAYVWQGLAHLPELTHRLRLEEELGQPIGDRRGNMHCAAGDQQNTHSLWMLSRKFIRLLLTSKVGHSLLLAGS